MAPSEVPQVPPGARRKGARPAGMQEMGQGLYEQIRRVLTELSVASVPRA
ncbi:hypothetical protein G4177_17185 [Corallococcus sp. ZKHCc1 1396]|uniref:GntR family transcriptional regulator n=1 Tax=Corallococcus soli TaxID=2710757 RepID=A0ABR9PPQ6_9BACT|nr:hypothetical protein [Corallococcus soli]MBE4749900.1 hypothetical protein [Corallococcus soli]